MKILIAEDDLTSRMMLDALLKKWGYETVSTENGRQVLDVLEKEDAPKLILLDWMMPEMDGLEVIQHIRSTGKVEPPYIILLTAKGDKKDIVHGLATGANDYVSKPYDRDELRARLEVGRRMVEMVANVIQSQKMAGLGNLASGMAHEINSPLQIIVGCSEDILDSMSHDDIDREALNRRAEMIHRNAWRIANLVRAVQDYVSVSPDQFVLANLNSLVKDVLLLIEHQTTDNADIEFKYELAENLPEFFCDRNKIIQTVLNLVSNARNAILYTGEIAICTGFDSQKERLILEVSDNGVGIPETFRNRIFDPFFTTRPLGQGAGMGLSIVQGVVRSHGGEIKVDSQPGVGTSFTLFFPLNIPIVKLDLREKVSRYDE